MARMLDVSPEDYVALIAYRDAHDKKRRGCKWREQLMSDWMADHRRQWGILRRIRNQYASDLQNLLASIPD